MTQVKLTALLKGLASYVPGARRYFCSGSGGTVSARYCYAVWMRHLVKAWQTGLITRLDKIAELGPGDSLGIGLCALLCGAKEYYALDAKPHASLERNNEIFDELVGLFERRSAIPDDGEFPSIFPVLEDHSFPRKILTENALQNSLHPDRLRAVRRALSDGRSGDGIRIIYIAPWQGVRLPEIEDGLDMVLSQAVMEHVEDVPGTYTELYRWLRPGGFMSHTIDYRSHGYARAWNGHWAVSDPIWAVIRGKRPYLINRLPHSAQIAAMENAGLTIVLEIRALESETSRKSLARRFRALDDDDLCTSGAFVQARKPMAVKV